MYVILGIIAGRLLYLIFWHLLWTATGSPAVRVQATAVDLLFVLAGACALFVTSRRSKDRWAWALAGGAIAGFLAHLTFYVSDFMLAGQREASRHFVEGKYLPSLRPRRFRLAPEVRLRAMDGRTSRIVLETDTFNRLVNGDSCVTLVERRGLLYRFATEIRIAQCGDGSGHWMQVQSNRQRCLSRR